MLPGERYDNDAGGNDSADRAGKFLKVKRDE